MNQQKLDLFGESIIEARDRSIFINYRCIDGLMLGNTSEVFVTLVNSLTHEQKEQLKVLTTCIIDLTVYELLRKIGNDSLGFSVGLKLDSEVQYESLSETDDELAGYLVSEDGWTAKYGKYPTIE